MKLYEINREIEALFDPETGELLDESAFENLQMEREQKIEHLILLFKNLTAEAKAVKEEADALAKRQKSIANHAERVKGYIGYVLNGEKFRTARCSVSFRASESVDIQDADALVRWLESSGFDDCIRYKNPEINKPAVKELLRAGQEIPGVQLCKNQNLVVR